MVGLAAAARWTSTAGALLAFGSLCLGLIAPRPLHATQSGWPRAPHRVLACICLATVMAGMLVFYGQACSVADVVPSGHSSLLRTLLLDTRFGTVWALRQACVIVAGVLLAASGRRGFDLAALGLLATCLVLLPFAGNSATVEPAWAAIALHAVHLLAAGAWWGALPGLVIGLARGARDGARRAVAALMLERFSRLALVCMIMLVGSGVYLGVIQVERWPALFARSYGLLLLAKLGLLAAILGLAAHVRWHLLPALRREPDVLSIRRFVRWIVAEAVCSALIVGCASLLAGTVPGRHAEIEWWLPFRLSIDATLGQPGAQGPFWFAVSSIFGALIGLITWPVLRGRLRLHRTIGAGLFAALLILLPRLAVEAYPDTYRRSSVPFQAVSVAAGGRLYQIHCASCHGASGHGDGPQAPRTVRTEPHTALHTAGDIYWWLTHGKPPGAMPGFGTRLSEDDKWDLINFLRLWSLGYQARILNARVVPMRPWLGALDFAYGRNDGISGTLRDLRGQSNVLLVLYTPGASDQRLIQLAASTAAFAAANLQLLVVPLRGGPAAGVPAIGDGGEDIATAYSLLRRSLSDFDARDWQPRPSHAEFLIDRHGYLRARWKLEEGPGWSRIEHLLAQVRLLAQEPQLLPPPDEHVH